jgi:hypothetical protein
MYMHHATCTHAQSPVSAQTTSPGFVRGRSQSEINSATLRRRAATPSPLSFRAAVSLVAAAHSKRYTQTCIHTHIILCLDVMRVCLSMRYIQCTLDLPVSSQTDLANPQPAELTAQLTQLPHTHRRAELPLSGSHVRGFAPG